MNLPVVTHTLCGLQCRTAVYWEMTTAEQDSWHCELLQHYYKLYGDMSLDYVFFKTQVQKSATKQLGCRSRKRVSLWFSSLARNYNSPVTKEKEMVLTEFSSHFHRLLCTRKDHYVHLSGSITYSKIETPVKILFYQFLIQHLVLKEREVIRQVLRVLWMGLSLTFSLSHTSTSCNKRQNCLMLCPYSIVTTEQWNCCQWKNVSNIK